MHDNDGERPDHGLADDLALGQRAALAGAALGLRYFERYSRLPRELKADGTVVTEADRAVEGAVRDLLLRERPADASLGEETGESGGGRRRWILDGIDGTVVFVRGGDNWQTLIALEIDGQIVVGIAAAPVQGTIWWAARGHGAFVAAIACGAIGPSRQLAVSPRSASLAESRLGVVPPLDELAPEYQAIASRLVGVTPARAWSSHPALHVAAGDLDLALQLVGSVWDFAALSLIVQEAGGTFSDADGRGHPVTGPAVYANGTALHTAALAHLVR